MEISTKKKKSPQLSRQLLLSCFALRRSSIAMILFFTVCEPPRNLCPLCSSRPSGDSVRPPESEQLLPWEAGRETESGFTEAGTRPHRGKSRDVLSHTRSWKLTWITDEVCVSDDHHQQETSELSTSRCELYVLYMVIFKNDILFFFSFLSIWEKVHISLRRQTSAPSVCHLLRYYSILLTVNIEWLWGELFMLPFR